MNSGNSGPPPVSEVAVFVTDAALISAIPPAPSSRTRSVDPDEALYEVQVDRVNTTATVWLGSTVACAQCHNHKYDPFSQKDYFRLMAFFANPAYTVDKHGAGFKYSEAQIDLATPEQDAQRTTLKAQLKAAEKSGDGQGGVQITATQTGSQVNGTITHGGG